MTLKPVPAVVGKICEYFDGVFFLQHTGPEDVSEIAKLIEEHDAEKDEEVKRLREMMKRLIVATYATSEWDEAMNAIGYEVTDEIKADEAKQAGKDGE